MSNQEELLYLREDVYFEPLFNQWYAWGALMSPLTAARHTVHTHRRIMKSFVKNYQLHMIAASQPGMAGGEFLNCKKEQLPEIKALVKKIDTELSDLVELSEAVKELDLILRAHDKGTSIEYLYDKVPDALKGFVEIVVDMEHNPSFRIFENLIYHSDFYKKELQTVSFGLLSKVEERPFCFSTPRLADENHIQLDIDFNSPMLDELLAARTTPITTSRVDAIFNSCNLKGGLDYRLLFTAKPPKRSHQKSDSSLNVQYLGHAGLMIETSNTSLLIDPIIASHDEKIENDVFGFSQLPEKIDYIFLTHSHQDHACIESLLQLRHKVGSVVVPRNNAGAIADPSLKLMLKMLKFNVIELDELESVDLVDGKGVALPFLGEHGDLNIYSKAAWLFEVEGRRIFAGADTSILEKSLYQKIHSLYGDLDILAIGMECVGAPYTWIYGALCSTPIPQDIKNSRRLNGSDAQQAFELVKIFNPNKVYLYALGLEPWYKYFMGIEYDESSTQIVESKKFISMCEQIDIPAACLYGNAKLDY